jgi:hypothetical protein
MDNHRVEYFLGWAVVILCAAACGIMVAMGAGCGATLAQTEADAAKLATSQTAITALKISQCVQGALAEEQLELLKQRREQEAADAEAADRLRSGIGVPSSISHEVDQIVRDAGVM